jgi:hypothetical protein
MFNPHMEAGNGALSTRSFQNSVEMIVAVTHGQMI